MVLETAAKQTAEEQKGKSKLSPQLILLEGVYHRFTRSSKKKTEVEPRTVEQSELLPKVEQKQGPDTSLTSSLHNSIGDL